MAAMPESPHGRPSPSTFSDIWPAAHGLYSPALKKVSAALEKAGVEFNADGRGVRLKPPKTKRKPK
jgi:hypothetical protein